MRQQETEIVTHTENEIIMTRDEVMREIEHRVARRGVTAAQVLRDHAAGRLDNPGDVADVLILADLLTERDRRRLR